MIDIKILKSQNYQILKQLKNKAYLKLENQIFFSADDAIMIN